MGNTQSLSRIVTDICGALEKSMTHIQRTESVVTGRDAKVGQVLLNWTEKLNTWIQGESSEMWHCYRKSYKKVKCYLETYLTFNTATLIRTRNQRKVVFLYMVHLIIKIVSKQQIPDLRGESEGSHCCCCSGSRQRVCFWHLESH